jgi:outer membrane cobalamin receptor
MLFSEGEKIMAVLTFLFFLFASPPDNLSGTILDPAGAVVTGARIEISGSGISRNISSNNSGAFSIEDIPPGAYSLRVTAKGFSVYTASIDVPSETLKLVLTVAPHSEDVIVTATPVETPLSMLGVSATVIGRDEISQRQDSPVYQMLRDVPGLSIANTGRRGGTTDVYTRGGGKEANLLLIDGVQVNDPGGTFNFAHLMPESVDRIEIVRGPQSASYGSNAAASVIQVLSHQGLPEDGLASGFASLEGGTFATYRYRTGFSGVARAFDYAFGVSHLQTEGSYTNDAYRNLTLSTNAGYHPNPNSQLRLTLRGIGSRVGVPNEVAYGLLDPDAFRADINIIGGVRYEGNHERYSDRLQFGFTRFRDYFQDNYPEGPFNIGAIVTGTPGARGSAGVRLVRFLSSTDLLLGDFIARPGERLVRRTVTLFASAPYKSVTERLSGEYRGNWNYSAGGSLGFGYDFEQERGSVTGVAPPLRNNHGLFANHQHSIGRKLFLTESIRLEENSVFGSKATPRFAVSYLLAPSTRLKASAGTGISEPTFLENFANNPAYVGNRSLRPERSRSVEAGIEQHLFRSALVVSETAFDNRFRDLIVFTFLPLPQPSTWINLEGSRGRGLESSARLQISRIRMSGGYTFLDTRVTAAASPTSAYTGIGQELPRRPRHSGSIDATAMFRRGFVDFNATFAGERQDTDNVGFGIVRNPRYQKVDVGGSYTLRPSVDLFARVENVLNHRYEEVLGYTSLRRNALLGLNVRWGHR